jgi:hypothetical protein
VDLDSVSGLSLYNRRTNQLVTRIDYIDPRRGKIIGVAAQNIDIVALSFSPVMNPNLVLDGLNELRAKLPRSVDIWAGGRSPVLQRRPPSGVRVISELSGLTQALVDWRHQSVTSS